MIVTDLKFMLFLLNLKAFGMELLRKRDNPEYKVTSHITANKFQEYFCMPVKFMYLFIFLMIIQMHLHTIIIWLDSIVQVLTEGCCG